MATPTKASRRENNEAAENSPDETGTNLLQRRFLPPFRKKSNKIKSPNAVDAELENKPVPETPQLINITIGDDIEILTPESKQRMDERIRRNLFPEDEGDEDHLTEPFSRIATSMSVEVTPDGKFLQSNDLESVEGTTMSPESFSAQDSPLDEGEDPLIARKTAYKGPVSVDTPEHSENDSVQSTPPITDTGIDTGVKVTVLENVQTEGQPIIFHNIPNTDVDMDDGSKDTATVDDTIFDDAEQTKAEGGDSGSVQDTKTARQLFGAFCADDGNFGSQATHFRQTIREISLSKNPVRRLIDLFYDNACSGTNVAEGNRPYFDEDFTLRFIRRMTTKGVALLYLQAPGTVGNNTNDWKGRTVAMLLKKGSPDPNEQESVQPRISWTTVVGGQTQDAITTSIDLFDIVSIKSSSKEDLLANQGLEEEREEFCFFTITVSNGQVYVFESNTLDERDSLVSGLKNVISRLAFQVTVGDVSALKELYLEEDAFTSNAALTGELPVLPNPMQAINRIAHVMLD